MKRYSESEHLMREALYRVGVYHVDGDELLALAARANDGRWFTARGKDYDRVAREYVLASSLRPTMKTRAASPYELERKS